MIRVTKWHVGTLLTAAALLLAVGRAGAQAPCFGDCNNSNTLTASDIGRINSTILRCGPCPGNIPGGVAAGCATLAGGCPGADFNTDGCLRASELARANQNILKYQPSGCAPTPTVVASPSPTPGGGGGAFCGDGNVDAGLGEVCDNGGSCFGGTNEGNLCTSQAECPGGTCQAFGGDGCAKNCTTEKTLTYAFSGALCKNHPQQSCTFSSACVGGALVGRPCSTNTDCGAGTCVSECGAGDYCVGDGECTVPGNPTKTPCFMADSTNEAKFCLAGANANKICTADADCPGSSCKGSCATAGGACENRSRSALVSLSLPVLIGPMIGSSIIRYGQPGADGMVPVATHLGDTVFAPVKVPGLVCACVRGGADPKSHGPGNNGSGVVNCGANPIQNDVTLAQDHSTATPLTCTDGPKKGMACLNKCAAGGGRAGKACIQDSDCPGDTSAQKKCNSITDCGSKQSNGTCVAGANAGKLCTADADCPTSTCNFVTNLQLCTSNNGPGACVGGTSAGRACFDSSQCLGGGKCTGKCVAGPSIGTACSCDGNTRVCETATSFACGAGGTCAIAGNGGGFCMGPSRFCAGGTADGKACFNAAECPGGGTCAGTGNFLGYCDQDSDCPGSLCNSIDDAACTRQDPPPPAGSGAKACLETKQICTSGPNLGQACVADNVCGTGGKCGTTCSLQATHPFVCNSPTHIVLSGSGGSGSGLFLNTIAIGTISDGGSCAFAALCMGGTNDAKQCYIAADCPGGTCAPAICAGTCAAGTAAGKNCLNNTDCPASSCTPGTNYKQTCTSNATCGTSTCVPVTGFATGGALNLGAGKGFDGVPCSDDDDPAVRGAFNTIPQTTGRALALVGDAQNIAGQQLVHRNCIQSAQGDNCRSTLVGSQLNCDDLLNSANPSASGLRLANAFTTLDGQTGDAVVTTFLTAK